MLRQARYSAPRGKNRLLSLGNYISRHYLTAQDKLIGFVGGPGAGKSLLIEGMIPDVTLTNDDEGVNVRPLPLLEDYFNNYFRGNTYHFDAQFEMAFYPLADLASAAMTALNHDKRVVIEHFERLYPVLNVNAQMLVGIGEEVIITRPDMFGPDPNYLHEMVTESLVYRKMVHTAEDLVTFTLRQMGKTLPDRFSEVTHGFVMEFKSKPDLNVEEISDRVWDMIRQDLPVFATDYSEICIGETITLDCSCPRVHVKSTGAVSGFQLLPELKQDPITKNYLLVGIVEKPTKLDL